MLFFLKKSVELNVCNFSCLSRPVEVEELNCLANKGRERECVWEICLKTIYIFAILFQDASDTEITSPFKEIYVESSVFILTGTLYNKVCYTPVRHHVNVLCVSTLFPLSEVWNEEKIWVTSGSSTVIPSMNNKESKTCYSKRPPQPSCVFLSILQLHAAHTDDLTHQEEALSDEVTAAQVLDTGMSQKKNSGDPMIQCFFSSFLDLPFKHLGSGVCLLICLWQLRLYSKNIYSIKCCSFDHSIHSIDCFQ